MSIPKRDCAHTQRKMACIPCLEDFHEIGYTLSLIEYIPFGAVYIRLRILHILPLQFGHLKNVYTFCFLEYTLCMLLGWCSKRMQIYARVCPKSSLAKTYANIRFERILFIGIRLRACMRRTIRIYSGTFQCNRGIYLTRYSLRFIPKCEDAERFRPKCEDAKRDCKRRLSQIIWDKRG